MSARLSIKDVSSVIVFTVFLKITAEAISVSILVKRNKKKKGAKGLNMFLKSALLGNKIAEKDIWP